jgi:putative flippase GtrA
MHDLLSVKGERYEFETNMLLETKARKIPIREVPIRTIYIDDNKSSHFNPFLDSIRIYMIFGKFIFSSVSASMIDMAIFILMCYVLRSADLWKDTFLGHFSYITLSTVCARVISCIFNYTMNLKVVFQSDGTVAKTFPKYVMLAVVQMCLSAFLVGHIHPVLGGPEVLTKIPVDLCLFFLSYFVQREVVYK